MTDDNKTLRTKNISNNTYVIVATRDGVDKYVSKDFPQPFQYTVKLEKAKSFTSIDLAKRFLDENEEMGLKKNVIINPRIKTVIHTHELLADDLAIPITVQNESKQRYHLDVAEVIISAFINTDIDFITYDDLDRYGKKLETILNVDTTQTTYGEYCSPFFNENTISRMLQKYSEFFTESTRFINSARCNKAGIELVKRTKNDYLIDEFEQYSSTLLSALTTTKLDVQDE